MTAHALFAAVENLMRRIDAARARNDERMVRLLAAEVTRLLS